MHKSFNNRHEFVSSVAICHIRDNSRKNLWSMNILHMNWERWVFFYQMSIVNLALIVTSLNFQHQPALTYHLMPVFNRSLRSHDEHCESFIYAHSAKFAIGICSIINSACIRYAVVIIVSVDPSLCIPSIAQHAHTYTHTAKLRSTHSY